MLWSLFLLCIVFICVYGEHYDWWKGEEIKTASVAAVLLLLVNLHRASVIDAPYIRIETFVQPKMFALFCLFGCMTLMSATSGELQNIYTGSILRYDTFHNITLNWGSFAGVLSGAGLSYMGLVRWKWRKKTVAFAGFAFFLAYQMMMYFLIDASTDKLMLYLPMFCKGAGLCIVYTVLTYTLAVSVPFPYYFEAMCVAGFIRTSFGNPLGSAIVTRLFNVIRQKNLALLGSAIDPMNPAAGDFTAVCNEVNRQVLLVSLKEVYGYAVLAAIIILCIIAISDFGEKLTAKMPKISAPTY